MSTDTIINLASDYLVAKMEKQSFQAQLDALPEVLKLKAKIEKAEAERALAQVSFLKAMHKSELLSLKTKEATFSIGRRETLKITEGLELELKRRIKEGEKIDYLTLSETEYLTVKTPKK